MNSTEKNRAESIEALSRLATLGLTMGMAYVGLRPMLIGEPAAEHSGFIGESVDHAFPIVDFFDWPLVAVILCGGALVWYVTKRIPKKVVQRAHTQGFMENTDWQDISGEERVYRPERERAAY